MVLTFSNWRREKLLHAPMREKLNHILALGIWCVLILFFVVITLWQASQTLQATQAAAKSLAELAAESNAAAVLFEDSAGAHKQLEIFRHIKNVETVDIYTKASGSVAFAHYPSRLGDVKSTPSTTPAAMLDGTQISQLTLSRYAIRLPIVQDGERIGLAQYHVPTGTSLEKALDLAQRIATNAPLTNYALMHALPRIAEQPADHGYLTEALISSIAQAAPEAKARVRAFLEGKAAKVQKS